MPLVICCQSPVGHRTRESSLQKLQRARRVRCRGPQSRENLFHQTQDRCARSGWDWSLLPRQLAHRISDLSYPSVESLLELAPNALRYMWFDSSLPQDMKYLIGKLSLRVHRRIEA